MNDLEREIIASLDAGTESDDLMLRSWDAIVADQPVTHPDVLVWLGVSSYEEHRELKAEVAEASGGVDLARLERLGLL